MKAWIISIVIMILGLFIGTHLTFSRMRGDVQESHIRLVTPVLHEQVQLVHNMLTIYQINTNSTDLEIESAINDQLEILAFVDLRPNLSERLMTYAGELQSWANSFNLSEEDARTMRNLYMDIQELDLVLSQSDYNDVAKEFNRKLSQGLGFLTFNVFRNITVYSE